LAHFKNFMFGASTVAMVMTMGSPVAFAQDADESIEEVVVTGSRRPARSGAETAAPVDVISGSDFQNQGGGDMTSLLRNVVPSYNVNAQPISDAATLIRPANLRGLAPDHTLVMVNGKRRHRGAVIAFLGGGLSDGAQGADVSVFPALALKQVDVLRDGAAAQYGSDAIAGVINFVLNDSAEGATFEAKYGSTFEGDGDAYQLGANYGMSLGNSGFLNMTFEFREADPTSRSVQRGDALGLIAGGNTDVRTPYAQIWGAPEVRNDWKAFFNMAVDAGENREFYAFGNYAQRETEGGFFFRNPDTRGGVFSNDGGVTRLVGDLTPGTVAEGGDGVDCPVVAVGDDAAYAAVAGDANCFMFNEMFPGGFTPQFGGNLNDVALAMGVRGEMDNGLTYDVSAHAGRNEADFFIDNTVNASFGPETPTLFRLGAYIQTEKNFNADFSYPVDMGMFSDLNVAFGFEWREEQFEAVTGQRESWDQGPLANQGFVVGSNGFTGFNPEVGGVWDRTNTAYYIDLEADVTEALTMGAAFRYEDFSDFGGTTNGKISALYRVSDGVAVRSTYSTGFRAPTPGQSNVNNISTVLEGGVLINRGTVSPTNPVAAYFGGKALDAEKSDNFTIGGAFKVGEGDLTVDYFHISMKDRITQTASINLTQELKDELEAAGIPGANDLKTFRFFTNDFSTKTQGVDVVFTYPFDLTEEGNTNLSVAANWTKTSVTSFDPTDDAELLDATRVAQIEKNLPRYRGNATLNHEQGDWRALVRMNYYGKYFEAHLDDGTLPINAGSEITFDMEFGYKIMDGLNLIVGAENILDNMPAKNPWSSIVGAQYAVTSPMGMNGGFYYARIRYEM